MKKTYYLHDMYNSAETSAFIDQVKIRIYQIGQHKKLIDTYLKTLPDGNIFIKTIRGSKRFYLKDSAGKIKYSPQKSKSTVLKLIQKDVLQKESQKIAQELVKLKELSAFYCNPKTKSAPNKMQVFNELLQKEQEERIATWKEEMTKTQNPLIKEKPLATENNEIVRSKSEKMSADKFYYKNVIYVYEPKLEIDGMTFFPDFMILNLRTGETFLYEHFGKLDDPEYCQKALFKINIYAKAGYKIGVNFFITTETPDNPFDPSFLDPIIDNFFL